jgi:hypothetical protein
MLDKHFTRVGYLPDGILERIKEIIVSYEVVNLVAILNCENNYRTTFISFCDHCIIIAEFCFYLWDTVGLTTMNNYSTPTIPIFIMRRFLVQ